MKELAGYFEQYQTPTIQVAESDKPLDTLPSSNKMAHYKNNIPEVKVQLKNQIWLNMSELDFPKVNLSRRKRTLLVSERKQSSKNREKIGKSISKVHTSHENLPQIKSMSKKVLKNHKMSSRDYISGSCKKRPSIQKLNKFSPYEVKDSDKQTVDKRYHRPSFGDTDSQVWEIEIKPWKDSNHISNL